MTRASEVRSTTILAVRKGGRVVVAGDGQVSVGNMIMKGGATKVRRLRDGKIISGFAGSAADGIALFEKLEGKLNEFAGNLTRAAVEMAKDWRLDRVLRRLEALLLVADASHTYVLSGSGDIIEPDTGVVAIGSGGGYATAAARALVEHSDLDARRIAEVAMAIAASLCIYTNDHITIEELG
jgi:ATP-dependent HslUV protease, peptidase subunit HslV